VIVAFLIHPRILLVATWNEEAVLVTWRPSLRSVSNSFQSWWTMVKAPRGAVADGRRIFISYRREDSQHVAGRLFDRLTAEFGHGNVFKDVDSIPLGDDFREHLQNAVGICNVMFVLIGDKWTAIRDSKGALRLHNPNDFVRLELEAALNRKIPVVPILIGDVQMPGIEELPEPLQKIHFRQATRLRPDPDFDTDISRIVRSLRPKQKPLPHDESSVETGEAKRSASIRFGTAVLVACAVIGAMLYWEPWSKPVPEKMVNDSLKYDDEGMYVELVPGRFEVTLMVARKVYEQVPVTYSVVQNGITEERERTNTVIRNVVELQTLYCDFYPLVKQKSVDGKTMHRVKVISQDWSEHIYYCMEPPSIRNLSQSDAVPAPAPEAVPAPAPPAESAPAPAP